VGDPGALLAEGRVDEAVAALVEAIAADDPPEASFLLGGLCYFDDDFDGARRHWEHAFDRFRRVGDDRGAIRVAAGLGELHWSAFGNRAASAGWLHKAERLLAGQGRCLERGYVNLALAACEHRDVDELERLAAEALDVATEFGDVALEVRALADSGYALVSQGRTAEGFARIDEALATISTGTVPDIAVVAMSFCAMLSACDQAGDAARAEEWTRLIGALLLDRFAGRPKVLHTHCRLAYGSVLCSIGRWTDGEDELLLALGNGAANAHVGEAAVRLAHLRVLQGRLDEAADLLAPHEDRSAAALPLALVHLASGEHDLAAAALQRGLDPIVGDRLRESQLLGALVQVELHRDLDRAAVVAERLAAIAERCDTPILCAEAGLAAGRVAAARGDGAAAVALLGEAARHLGPDDRPLLAGTILRERAAALAATGDTAAAVTEARAALAVFERLGAQPDVDRTAALLRSLGAPGARPRAAVGELTARERDVLDLLRQGLTNAEIGGRLYISAKTVEHHVGRVLTKLGVRSRAEAAAVAAAAARGAN
jgi:DNA-binding CsgD family transcriptional regulator